MLIYAVLEVLLLAQAALVWRMPETVTRKPGALAALRPHLRVPPQVRFAMWLAVPALVAAWAIVGFYGSLAPALVRRALGSHAPALGGIALFTLAVAGGVTILLARRMVAIKTLRLGAAALVIGVTGVLAATFWSSPAGFFAATAIIGVGFGGSFHGGIRSVLSVAPAEHRAGVLAVLYVIAYLSMGVPAVLGGIRVVHGGGLVGTAYEYGATVIALAAAALAGTFLRAPAARYAFPAHCTRPA